MGENTGGNGCRSLAQNGHGLGGGGICCSVSEFQEKSLAGLVSYCQSTWNVREMGERGKKRGMEREGGD